MAWCQTCDKPIEAITSTNDGQIYWCINASLDLSELKDLSFNSSPHIIL